MDSFCKHIFPLINMSKTIRPGADLVGVCRGAHRPPPLPSWDDLRLSNTTGILQNMKICMICILSSSHHIIRDLKQRRQQRQKKKLVLRAKQLLCSCITLFSKFLWRPLHDYDVKAYQCDVQWRTWKYYDKFSLLYLNMDKALKNSTSGNWSRLYLNNWAVPNRRDKVWFIF